VTFAEAARVCLNKYVTFSGRACRSEYWWFALLYTGVYLIGAIVDNAVGTSIFAVLAGLGLLLPMLAVSVRRLHDTNRSGWWYWLSIVPFGFLVLLVFFCQDGGPVVNGYGPSPKPLTGSSASFG
jgi:uncharacterized membrane protein YhaH (DUF805 family)